MKMSRRIDEKNIADLYESILKEDMGAGDVYGDVGEHGGDIENSDFYANGDARYPFLVGIQSRKGKISPKKKKNKKKPKNTIDI